MGGTGGMQMNAAQMQHQQLIRSQSGGIAGSGMGNTTQMQQLLSQQHQQQTLAMQQSNNQMSLQMQMTQSSSVNSVSSTGTGEFWPMAVPLAPNPFHFRSGCTESATEGFRIIRDIRLPKWLTLTELK